MNATERAPSFCLSSSCSGFNAPAPITVRLARVRYSSYNIVISGMVTRQSNVVTVLMAAAYPGSRS